MEHDSVSYAVRINFTKLLMFPLLAEEQERTEENTRYELMQIG